VTKLVKIQTVDSMTSRVDCFRPKTIRSLVLIKLTNLEPMGVREGVNEY
jgi:hypothetical protein